MRRTKIIVIAVVIVAIIGGLIGLLSYEGYIQFPNTTSGGPVDHFTIIESDPPSPLAGINGSYYKSTSVQWPVLHVQKGDTVVITIINNGTEPHGFAIDHYDSSGISTSAGQNHTITFVATIAGTFRVYCNIFCLIHPFMQNGVLIVNS